MKTVKYIFIATVIMIFSIHDKTNGQEKGNNLSLGFSITHFKGLLQPDAYVPDSYNFLKSPGIEFLYGRKISKVFEITTGAEITNGQFYTQFFEPDWYIQPIFHFNQISFPVILRTSFRKTGIRAFSSAGLYFGYLKNIKVKHLSKKDWVEIENYERISNFSSDRKFIDFYADTGIGIRIRTTSEIAIVPFLKYRLNNAWIDYYKHKSNIGIKITYLKLL